MITVNLKGGLGNQMFQYAFGRALSLRLQTNLSLNIHWYNDQDPKATKRSFGLQPFSITARLVDIPLENNLKRRIKKAFGLGSIRYESQQFVFDQTIGVAKDETIFDGYWQTEKYFLDYADAIRKDFSLKNPLSKKAQEVNALIGNLHSQNSVSLGIHVRRGDYVSDKKTNTFHGVCDETYYHKALETIMNKLPEKNIHCFIFSDDNTWAKKNLVLEKVQVTYVSDYSLADYEELVLMSHCDHAIISNSTFGWWAAWLNANPHKIVVAPSHWIQKAMPTQDIVPQTWLQL
jgi:hypothetical protein